MSTITDKAVRAVTSVLGETGDQYNAGGALTYWHGPECEHRACRIVNGLADSGQLDYAPRDATVDLLTSLQAQITILRTDGTLSGQDCTAIVHALWGEHLLWTGAPRVVADAGACGCIDILCAHRGLDPDGGPYDVQSTTTDGPAPVLPAERAAETGDELPAADEDEYDRRVDDALFSLVRYWAENPNVREVVAGRAKPLRDRLDALLHITGSESPTDEAPQGGTR